MAVVSVSSADERAGLGFQGFPVWVAIERFVVLRHDKKPARSIGGVLRRGRNDPVDVKVKPVSRAVGLLIGDNARFQGHSPNRGI